MSKEDHAYYLHTEKAIKKGNPENRLFAVVRKQGSRLVAWKCVLYKDGSIWHPAYTEKLFPSKDDEKIFIEKGENGSEPTALFKKDSFYKEIKF